jgi:2-polyprenyl-6-methoxyphenol hydroxylase-like FAD-dependent oxidoreductase
MLMGATPRRAIADTELCRLLGDDPVTTRVRDTTMVLGSLRFTAPPMAARRRWLPDLPLSAVADLEDYVMWALPGRCDATELTAGLPPVLQAVVAEAWPDVTVALRIGVIPPIPAWPPSPVTVLGDAVHLAPGFGGNLAMQDAQHLCEALVDAEHGHLLDAIGAYEETMRRNSFALIPAGKS